MDFNKVFEDFNNLHVLVIGDVMLDSYTFGDVTRISPEAPVPIVNVTHSENRLGGAANVALNLKSLGASVTIAAPIGDDDEGKTIKQLLLEKSIKIDGVLELKNRKTTVKNRVIANKHQLLRLDTETIDELESEDNQIFIAQIKSILNEQKVDAVVFEDYDKGGLNKALIVHIIELTTSKNIPTAVDPKKRNFEYYNGATLFKPNLRELHEGIGFKGSKQQLIKDIEVIGKNYCAQHQYKFLFTTLSEYGVYICDENKGYKEDAHLRSIADVSGAGDTVIAVATLCLALQLPMETIAQVSNIAGGLVCEKVGVVPIDKNELLRECEQILI